MKKQPKVPTSEAALKRAQKKMGYDPILQILSSVSEPYLCQFNNSIEADKFAYCAIWRGRLSDLYRKRKPLKGVAKKLKRAIR